MRRATAAFLIWREGDALNWNCTRHDLARAIGLDYTTVCSIMRERGWALPSHPDRGHGTKDWLREAMDPGCDILPVDVAIAASLRAA